MRKKYSSNWDAQKLTINFNQKQWRQDLAAFIKEKKFWNVTRVTRARVVSDVSSEQGIKYFEVYNLCGSSIRVVYANENEIVSSDEQELVKKYIEERVK